MTKVYISGDQLACAFPVAIRADVQLATFRFPATRLLLGNFSVRVEDEVMTLPRRIHNDPALIRLDQLTDLQREAVDCLLTRHSDGFVRQQHLGRIIHSRNVWVPPFVIQLVGEYVIEILQVVKQNLQNLDAFVYGNFLRANPDFFGTTERRVISYWDCYYRDQKREDYVGFQLLEFFRSLQRNIDGPLSE
jgi:hypothetical protein